MPLSTTKTDLSTSVAAAHARALRDPVWFMRNVLNIETKESDRRRGQSWDLDEWQHELIESVADVYRHSAGQLTRFNHAGLNKITVRAMHGPGKTFGVAAIMHWFGFCFKGTIVCTAPKEKQLRTRLWPAFRKIRSRAGEAYASLMNVDAAKIVWCGDEDWAAHAETASEPENLAGYHDEHLLFIVEEASGIREEMFPVIEGAISAGRLVILILIGNPTRNQGTFYDSHRTPSVAKHYYPIHVDLSKTTRVSAAWVQQMKDKYGENSPVFQIRCLGDFADSDEKQLVPYEHIASAIERDEVDDGTIPSIRVTVDVSDGGLDESIITAVRMRESHKHILSMTRHSFRAAESPILTAEAAERAFLAAGGNMRTDDMVVDGLGVGAGTAGYLLKKGYRVVVYKGGESSDIPDQWRNRRVQSYIGLAQALANGAVSFAEDYAGDKDIEDDMLAQVCAIQRNNKTERIEDIEPKEAHIARTGKSPDIADGLAMIYATQIPQMASPELVALPAYVINATPMMESANADW